MKELKVVGQVLAAIAYTCIFTGLLYMILVLPLAWLLTLKPVVLILVLLMLGGFLQFVVFGLQTLLMVPYAWIVKNNVVALVISVGLMIFNLIRNDVAVWQGMLGHGRSALVVAVIITILIAEALIMSVVGVISTYLDSKESHSYRKESRKQAPIPNASIAQSEPDNTGSGLIPVSKMDKGDMFPVEYDGNRYWAMLDAHTIDCPVVSIYDNESAEDYPVDAAIDDMTYEMWEAIRVNEEKP